MARETLLVQIVPPSKTQIMAGDQLTLTAQASGGPGGYNYQWYINNTAVEGATTATYVLSPTQTGRYSINCTATDATGVISDIAASQTISISVSARAIAAGTAPQGGGPLGGSNAGSLSLQTTIIIAVVVMVIAAIVVTVIMVQRRSKKQVRQ